MSKRVTPEAAESTLKTFFKDAQVGAELVNDQMYKVAGRVGYSVKKNEAWLANRLTPLYRYRYVEPLYEVKGKVKKRVAIRLRPEGVRALNRVTQEPEEFVKPQEAVISKTTFNEALQVLKQWREQNPEFEVTLKIELKDTE